MPKPTAAANAAPLPATTRRAVLKAAGALGTITTLAVPVAILPEAMAAEHPDVALLAMGRELEARLADERKLAAEEARLSDVTKRIAPAPSPELLAYQHEGEPLLHRLSGGAWVINVPVLDYVRDCGRAWRVTGFCEGACPENDVLKHLEAWREGGSQARIVSGAYAASQEWERAFEAIHDVCKRIVAAPAATADGIRVKLMALRIRRGHDS